MVRKITRRQVLAGSAGFGAAALFLPGLIARSYAANERLNVALVGCGTRGRGLMEAIRQVGENLVALCDANEQRAAQAFAMAPEEEVGRISRCAIGKFWLA